MSNGEGSGDVAVPGAPASVREGGATPAATYASALIASSGAAALAWIWGAPVLPVGALPPTAPQPMPRSLQLALALILLAVIVFLVWTVWQETTRPEIFVCPQGFWVIAADPTAPCTTAAACRAGGQLTDDTSLSCMDATECQRAGRYVDVAAGACRSAAICRADERLVDAGRGLCTSKAECETQANRCVVGHASLCADASDRFAHGVAQDAASAAATCIGHDECAARGWSIDTSAGTCVPQCAPGMYVYNSACVTAAQCTRALGGVLHESDRACVQPEDCGGCHVTATGTCADTLARFEWQWMQDAASPTACMTLEACASRGDVLNVPANYAATDGAVYCGTAADCAPDKGLVLMHPPDPEQPMLCTDVSGCTTTLNMANNTCEPCPDPHNALSFFDGVRTRCRNQIGLCTGATPVADLMRGCLSIQDCIAKPTACYMDVENVCYDDAVLTGANLLRDTLPGAVGHCTHPRECAQRAPDTSGVGWLPSLADSTCITTVDCTRQGNVFLQSPAFAGPWGPEVPLTCVSPGQCTTQFGGVTDHTGRVCVPACNANEVVHVDPATGAHACLTAQECGAQPGLFTLPRNLTTEPTRTSAAAAGVQTCWTEAGCRAVGMLPVDDGGPYKYCVAEADCGPVVPGLVLHNTPEGTACVSLEACKNYRGNGGVLVGAPGDSPRYRCLSLAECRNSGYFVRQLAGVPWFTCIDGQQACYDWANGGNAFPIVGGQCIYHPEVAP